MISTINNTQKEFQYNNISEAFYDLIISDYNNWSLLENSIIFESASDKAKEIIDKAKNAIKEFIKKVIEILVTWKQKVNIFIGNISVKFIPKNHNESVTIVSKDWTKIHEKVMDIDYIIIPGFSWIDTESILPDWVDNGDSITSANIIKHISKDMKDTAIIFTVDDIKSGLNNAKQHLNSIFNEGMKMRDFGEKLIKELNKKMYETEDKYFVFINYIRRIKEMNKWNFTLMQAKLNSYNEYIKLLGKSARNFKTKEKEQPVDYGDLKVPAVV